ncbi:hypothetical protein J6590_099440 [Homalodisca vitripennis]|nr:hypothetical protein J6590_099440 [Homalodisca vitripennis]
MFHYRRERPTGYKTDNPNADCSACTKAIAPTPIFLLSQLSRRPSSLADRDEQGLGHDTSGGWAVSVVRAQI